MAPPLDDSFFTLLPSKPQSPPPPPPSSSPDRPPPPPDADRVQSGVRRPRRRRRPEKPDLENPPYQWATTTRANVHSLQRLHESGIKKITGRVQCRQCEKITVIEYDLQEKFSEIASFIVKKQFEMHRRAPAMWRNPASLDCEFCRKTNCVRPEITRKRSINWVFLFLGQMLGFCKLSELKYFCKHRKKHRTGAKDRLLYDVYVDLCKQLDPTEPYDL